MWLGRVLPMGNPSYLAHVMGADGPPQQRVAGMAPATFACPACGGTASAIAHPTVVGAMTLTCAGKGCDPNALTRMCRERAPRAFAHSDDLLIGMPDEVIEALIARAMHGTYTAGHKDAMRAIDMRRAVASGVTPYVLRNADGGAVILILRYEEERDGSPPRACSISTWPWIWTGGLRPRSACPKVPGRCLAWTTSRSIPTSPG